MANVERVRRPRNLNLTTKPQAHNFDRLQILTGPGNLSRYQQQNILAGLAFHEEIGRLVFRMFEGPQIFEGDYKMIATRLWKYWERKNRPPMLHTLDMYDDIITDPKNHRAPTIRRILVEMLEWSENLEKGRFYKDDIIEDLVSFISQQENKTVTIKSAEILNGNTGVMLAEERNAQVQALWEGRRYAALGQAYKIEPMDSAALLEQKFNPRDFLMAPWLKRSSLTFVHAFRGEGKTLFCMSLAYHLATGMSFLGWEAARAAKVLYVDSELPGALLQQRMRELGPPCPNIIWLPFETFQQYNVQMPDLGSQAGQQYLEYLLEHHNAEVLFLDNISTMIRSNQSANDEEYWRPIEPWLTGLRAKGRTVFFLGHDGKGGKQRGTSKKEDTLDTSISLKLDNNQTVTTINLVWDKHRDFHGEDAQPLTLTAENSPEGTVSWTGANKATATKIAIREHLRLGSMTQAQIAKELNVTRQYVSLVAAELQAEQTREAMHKHRVERKTVLTKDED